MKTLLLIHAVFLAMRMFAQQEHIDIILYSTETGIGDNPGWSWWTGESACPSGIARVASSSATVADAWITNNFPAGVYSPYLKVMAYGTTTNLLAEMDAGGNVSAAYCNDRDENQYWTVFPTQLVIPVTTNVLHVRLSKPTAISPGSILELFLTTRTNLIITSDDYAQFWPTNLVENVLPPRPGNLVYNGSFEVGTGGWSFTPNDAKFAAIRDLWSGHEFRFRAQPCTRTAGGNPQLLSQNFYVRGNKRHVLSFRARSEPDGAQITGSMRAAVAVPDGYGLPPQTNYATAKTPLTTNWITISTNAVLPSYPPPGQYYVQFEFANLTPETVVFLDDVRVEEGNTPGTNNAVEIGFENTVLGGRYSGDPVIEILGGPGTATVEVYDATFNRVRLLTSVNVPGRLTIPYCPYGPMRLSGWLENGSESEIYFCKLKGTTPNPRMGTHAEQWWYNNQLAAPVYAWNRALSPAALFRWQFVEPKDDGQFVFESDDVDKTLQSGQKLLGVLYQQRAAWANRWYMTLTNISGTLSPGDRVTQGGAAGNISWIASAQSVTGPAIQLTNVTGTFTQNQPITGPKGSAVQASVVYANSPAIERYAQYASETVKHYAGIVDSWEIVNEPNLDSTIPKPAGQEFAFYCEMIRQSVALMPSSAFLIAGSGVNQTNDLASIWRLLPQETQQRINALSIHLYEGDSFRAQQFVSLNLGPPIWNTEAGVYQFSAWYGRRGAFRNNGIPLLRFRDSEDFMRSYCEAVEVQSWNVIQSIGGGCDRHFFYDGRFYHHYGAPTSYSAQYTELDFQETLKPLGIANATLAWVIQDGPRQKLPTPAHSEAWRIGDWLFVRSMDRNQYRINTTDPTLDIWGNASEVGVYGGKPSLIHPANWDATSAALNSATLIPDTAPPQIVWCEYPKAIDDSPVSRIRWLAADQQYTSRKFFNAIQFRLIIDGESGEWTTRTSLEIRKGGKHTITVDARDVSGNQSSASIQIERVATEPEPPPQAPGTVVSVRRVGSNLVLAGIDVVKVNGAVLHWPYAVPEVGQLVVEYCAFDGSKHSMTIQ